ncbi:MAG: MBL fold metallo-hydrolase [Oscillospiraceae bacterium]|nr:MBL fold metallo-hydrolase [Oscillospiraceae bacterium]
MPSRSRKSPRASGGKNNRGSYSIFLVIIGIAVAALINFVGRDPISDFFGLSDKPIVSRAAEGTVQVHFIDVGQGDCAFVLTDESAVLIDGGDSQYADTVIQYIRRLGVETLDLIIVSHPHADHMGGMGQIIEAVNPDMLIMSQIPDEHVPTTNAFMRMLDAVEAHSVDIDYARAGDIFTFGDAVFEIIAPEAGFGFVGINNSSVVVRLNHGDNSFLFTGDIESEAEDYILESGADIMADVLKVAHHGSATSSGRGILSAVNGTYAVISVGSPNRYNHPNDDVVRRIAGAGYEILRTDRSGTIVFESNPDGLLNIISDIILEETA